MAASQTTLVFTFDHPAEYHLLLHRPRPDDTGSGTG